VLEPFEEILIVFCSALVGLVCLVRNVIAGVGPVDAHAALYTPAHLLAERARHILLLMQVLLALVDMREAVDRFARYMALGQDKVLEPGILGEIIGCPGGIDGVHLQLIGAVDEMAVVIHVSAHLTQPFDELFLGTESVRLSFAVCRHNTSCTQVNILACLWLPAKGENKLMY
jgi:hypothetical protein